MWFPELPGKLYLALFPWIDLKDPFGHSQLTPTVFRRLGYDALVINRIHYSYKEALKGSRDMEFFWRDISDPSESIFTHVLHTHYSSPQYELMTNFRSTSQRVQL